MVKGGSEVKINLKYVAKFQPPLCGQFWVAVRNDATRTSMVLEYV